MSFLQTGVVTIGEGINLDAFSRLRTSDPGYRFDAQFTYALNTDIWDSKPNLSGASGTIVYDSTYRLTTLSTVGAASVNVLQSHYNAPYTPGRSHLALITFRMGAENTGVVKRVGLYDEIGNGTYPYGIYLEKSGSSAPTLNINSGMNATESVSQASWNVDPLTGSGPSGLTLDLTKTQIFVINFQALYVGEVTVGFDIGGTIVPVHTFNHANTSAGEISGVAQPYIQQASLPVHYSVRAAGASSGSMAAICASVISEGGQTLADMPGRSFTFNNGVTAAAGTAARTVALAIQCQQTFNSIRQNALVLPVGINAVCNQDTLIEVVRNATYSGAMTFGTTVDATSTVLGSTTTGVTATAGTVVDSFYIPAASGGTTRNAASIALGGKVALCYSHLLGVADTLSICYSRVSGATTFYSALTWKEIR